MKKNHQNEALSSAKVPLSGLLGGRVSGAVDTILVMANKPNGAVLDIRGRDVESAELAIEFDKQKCRWRLLGNAAEVHVSKQRAKIIAALKEASLAMTIPALMEETGIKRNPLDVLLGRMAKEGKIQRIGKGLYAHLDYVSPPNDPPPANPPNKTKHGNSKRGAPREAGHELRRVLGYYSFFLRCRAADAHELRVYLREWQERHPDPLHPRTGDHTIISLFDLVNTMLDIIRPDNKAAEHT